MESESGGGMDGYDVVERSTDYRVLNRYLRRLRGERLLKLRFQQRKLTLHLGPPHLDLAGQREGIPRGSFVVEVFGGAWRLEAPDAFYDDVWIATRADPEAARREVESWADESLGLAVHDVEAAPPTTIAVEPESRPALRMLLASDEAFVVLEVEPAENGGRTIWDLATPFERRLAMHADGAWSYQAVER